MRKKMILAALLAVCMLLTGCKLIVEDTDVTAQIRQEKEAADAATEIINVNGTSISKTQVNEAIDDYLVYMQQYYDYYGVGYQIDPTDTEMRASVQSYVVEGLVQDEVVRQKMAAADVESQLTDEDKQEIEDDWKQRYDLISSAFYGESELTGDELDAAIRADVTRYFGVTEESLRNTHVQKKFYDLTVGDVKATDEEIQADFDSKVEAAKTSYESNLSAYGTAVNGGETVYYRPAGYRMVKQILCGFDPLDEQVVSQLKEKVSAQETAVKTYTDSLTAAGVADIDALLAQVSVTVDSANPVELPAQAEDGATPTDLIATVTDLPVASTSAFADDVDEAVREDAVLLAEARALKDAYDKLLAEATETAFANITEKANAIVAAARGGEDWTALTAEYNSDPGMEAGAATAETGYAVCENMSGFDAAFTAAAMALENVGDVSEPTRGSFDGFFIIRYESDVAEGPVDLADVRDGIESALTSTKQDEAYDAKIQQWISESAVTYNLDAMKD